MLVICAGADTDGNGLFFVNSKTDKNLIYAGADGIYTFNGFFAGPETWNEIGSMKTMAGKTKLFGIDRFGGESSFSSSEDSRRVAVKPVEPLHAHFQVGEDPAAAFSSSHVGADSRGRDAGRSQWCFSRGFEAIGPSGCSAVGMLAGMQCG
jgi:hypothetical protein